VRDATSKEAKLARPKKRQRDADGAHDATDR
jgi:hypothetical protein